MTPKPTDPFFVGYGRIIPRSVAMVALTAALTMTGILFAQALMLPLSAADGGPGGYANDLKGGTLTGVIDALPYPILRVAASDDAPARAYLMGGQAKNGVAVRTGQMAGAQVTVGGVFVRRGDMEILLSNNNQINPAPDAAAFTPAPPQDLGRWRLVGEICDGKCYAGAMKPGSGLAHKACANLCIQTGLPPVLVMALPVEGATEVVLADQDGGPMPAALLDMTAIPVQMDGHLERRDDLLVFRIDAGSVRSR